MPSDDLRADLAEAVTRALAGLERREPDSVELHHTELVLRRDTHQDTPEVKARSETDAVTDAVMAVLQKELARAYFERDQYHAAIQHLLLTLRSTYVAWSRNMPDTLRTADVVSALSGICSHIPDRPELRTDLWQRLVGAYYARFENDGHPEDSRAAADEAMAIVQPELDRLQGELDENVSVIRALRRQRDAAEQQLAEIRRSAT